VHPILWEADIQNFEIFIIEDFESEEEYMPNACGLEIESLNIQHKPKAREENNNSGAIYSAYELTQPILKKIPPCYRTADYDFVLSFSGNDATFTALIVDNEDKIIRSELSDHLAFSLELASDYNKDLDQRNVALHLSKLDPNLKEQPSWNVNITPQFLEAISDIITAQISEAKQFSFLFRFIRAPAADLVEHFNRLHAELNNSQRAITRALFIHDSLKNSVKAIQMEMMEKEEALQTAIEDKLRLTQMLADAMATEFSKTSTIQRKNSSALVAQQQKTPLNVQSILPVESVSESKSIVIMEGNCSVLLAESQVWRRVFGVILGTDLIFLTQKIPLNELRDPVLRKKSLYSSIKLLDSTEVFNTYAPVYEKEPKKVLFVSNSGTDFVYFNAENEQTMADWTRIIQATIKTKKEEKQELERLERERIENQEREEREKREQEERERLEQEKKKQEEDELMNKEREFNIEKNCVSVGTQTDFDDGQEKMSRDQRTLREINDLMVQFDIMKESLHAAKLEHDELVRKMTDLTEYVRQVKDEETSRLESIQKKIQQETERNKQFELINAENAALREQLMDRGKKVLELQRDLEKERQTLARYKEEHQLVADSLKLNYLIIEDNLKKLENENTILKREIEVYESRMPTTPVKGRSFSVKSMPKEVSSPDNDSVNAELKLIIQDLYQKLAQKDDEINALRIKNIELNSRGEEPVATSSSRQSLSIPPIPVNTTTTASKQLPLPPKPLMKEGNRASLPLPPLPKKLTPAPLPFSNQSAPLIGKQKLMSSFASLKSKVADKKDKLVDRISDKIDMVRYGSPSVTSTPKSTSGELDSRSTISNESISTNTRDEQQEGLLLDFTSSVSSPDVSSMNTATPQEMSLTPPNTSPMPEISNTQQEESTVIQETHVTSPEIFPKEKGE
jgi:hypothetical protein